MLHYSPTNTKMRSLLYHGWIVGCIITCLFGSQIVNSDNSYLTQYETYYDDYRVETNDPVIKYNVPETYYRYSHATDDSNLENHYTKKKKLSNLPFYPISYDHVPSSQDILDPMLNPGDNDENNNWMDEVILEKMNLLERLLSDEPEDKDFETKNSINDKIILDSIMTEDTKRVVRQVRKQKPGFFWTLAKITFETFNDTTSAIKQISSIVSNAIGPDTTTIKSTSSDSLMSSSQTLNETQNETTATTESTTTSKNSTLTRSELQSLIVRNIKGLIRLFNIEWQDALKQSDINANEFRKDLGKQVGTYLQDNPNAY